MSWPDPPEGPLVIQPYDSPGHPLAPWFEFWRQQRRERHASRKPVAARRSAVLTIVQNESIFFPIWLGYYSRYFGAQDIYVLDHDSTDGSTEGGGFVRIPVSHDSFDNSWMVSTVERHQRELLESYDVVVVVDVDEIVAPAPPLGTLGDYLARFDEEWVNCLGYEVLHQAGSEPPFDPGKPVLEQRSTWFASTAYDKPAIAATPLSWRPGFHGRTDYHFNGDPDLRLIHLHRMDYEICKERHRRWRGVRWNQRDLDEGWGVHNRVTADEEFDRWFYEDSALENYPLVPEPILPDWKGVV
jgi:hypothetical protein